MDGSEEESHYHPYTYVYLYLGVRQTLTQVYHLVPFSFFLLTSDEVQTCDGNLLIVMCRDMSAYKASFAAEVVRLIFLSVHEVEGRSRRDPRRFEICLTTPPCC